MKRIIALILAMLMLLTMFAGCSKKPADTSTSDTSSESKKEETKKEEKKEEPKKEEKKEEPKKEEKKEEAAKPDTSGDDIPELTLFKADNNVPEYPLNMERPNMIKIHDTLLELFNVNWQLETVIGEKFEETLNTRLAAGVDLPDMIFHRFADSRLLEVYNNGLILGLNDLIDEYGPDVKANMTVEMPYLTIANGTADGEILRVPQVVANIQHQVTTLNIRWDWLQKLGLDVPTTTEDFKNALVAFNEAKVNDVGGIVFLTSYGNMNFSLGTAFGAFNVRGGSSSWWYDENKQVYNSMLTDNMRDYVAYVANLYEEGLIFPAFTNYTADQWNEVLYANKAGAGCGAWWDGVINVGTLKTKGIEGEVIPIRNLEYNGESINILRNLGGYGGFMITKDCDCPDKAMQVINYGYTLDGTKLDYNGEFYPGGEYYVAVDESKLDPRLTNRLAPGKMVYTDKGNKLMAENPKAWNMMGWNTAVLGQWLIGAAGDIALEFSDAFRDCGKAADIDWNLDNLNFFIENGVTQIGFAMPTDEQATAIDEYADLFTYMDENIQLFMMGSRNMSEWDDFVAECKSLGIDDVTAIYQDRFDSYVAVMDEMGAVVFTQ
ncbi:MAG: extracellular solute-binding protein [Clostridiales bacterium]|nr:extracellular solute-binding protein [Clostridiales bacterium]